MALATRPAETAMMASAATVATVCRRANDEQVVGSGQGDQAHPDRHGDSGPAEPRARARAGPSGPRRPRGPPAPARMAATVSEEEAGGDQQPPEHVAGEVPAQHHERGRDPDHVSRGHRGDDNPQPRRSHQHGGECDRHRARRVPARVGLGAHLFRAQNRVDSEDARAPPAGPGRSGWRRQPAPAPRPPPGGGRASSPRRTARRAMTASGSGSAECTSGSPTPWETGPSSAISPWSAVASRRPTGAIA